MKQHLVSLNFLEKSNITRQLLACAMLEHLGYTAIAATCLHCSLIYPLLFSSFVQACDRCRIEMYFKGDWQG